MASEALKKIYESDLNDDSKTHISTILLAYQGIAKESYDRYNDLSLRLPSLVGKKGTRRKEKEAWVSFAQSLLTQYKKDKVLYDNVVNEIISSNSLQDLIVKYA